MLMEILFWSIFIILVYGYIGYFIILRFIFFFKERPVAVKPIEPDITVLITAYNEEKHIRRKIEDIISNGYPHDKMEIIVASDGSVDGTDLLVWPLRGTGVKLVRVAGRKGKTNAQNEAVKEARGEIIVFSDATTSYEKGALAKLVRNFNDPEVGCVSGRLRYTGDRANGVACGTQSYWEYEVAIKTYQSRIWSLTGATGCIYAVRRALYKELPADIISDLVEPLAVLEQGYRTVFEKEAVAYEETGGEEKDEIQMRVRVISRGMRGLLYMKRLFNPLKHPYYFFQIISHKVIRWFYFELSLMLLAANLYVLPNHWIYAAALLCQAVFYGSALSAYAVKRIAKKEIRMFRYALYFCLINTASLVSLFEILKGNKRVIWETKR